MAQSITQYNKLAKFLHWLSAIVIISLFAVGLWMVDLNYYSEWYKTAPHVHKSVGLILFFVTLFRIIWKKITPSPEIEGKKWEKQGAKIAHTAIYILLFCIMTSGYLISTADGSSIDIFNWVSIPGLGSFVENQEDIAGNVHYYLAITLIGLAVLHALAALKHHFINKDNTLKKML
jgi:cytochrome b561